MSRRRRRRDGGGRKSAIESGMKGRARSSRARSFFFGSPLQIRNHRLMRRAHIRADPTLDAMPVGVGENVIDARVRPARVVRPAETQARAGKRIGVTGEMIAV